MTLPRLLLLLVTLLPGLAAAGQLYQFKDADGNVLLTNQVNRDRRPLHHDNHRFNQLLKVTWYPDTNVHTYTDWGRGEAAVKAGAAQQRNRFDAVIQAAAARHGVAFGLVKAVIHTESGFDPQARSQPGAQGLMQLMPATARRYGVANVWDPVENIQAGARHLRYLMDRYGRVDLALAAYNAGEGNVDRYRGIPPFPETRDYVARVTGRFSRLYNGDQTAN